MLLFTFLLCIVSLVHCENVFHGSNNYTTINLGNINIMITSAHGGQEKPEDIETRNTDSIGNLKGDFNTKEISFVIRDHLQELFENAGYSHNLPFLVYNNLHREKMDPNRDANQSCENSIDNCTQAYNDFHRFIEKYFNEDFMILGSTRYKQGLLIDIHGQSHKEGWIELGYLLSSATLDGDKQISPESSSIRQIAALSSYTFEDLIRGPQSLGSIFQTKCNFDTVPSSKFKSPNKGNYYSGGYITKVHGSRSLPKHRVSAIQLELPFKLRSNTEYENSGKLIAKAVYEFYVINRLGDLEISASSCGRFSSFSFVFMSLFIAFSIY